MSFKKAFFDAVGEYVNEYNGETFIDEVLNIEESVAHWVFGSQDLVEVSYRGVASEYASVTLPMTMSELIEALV